MENSIQNQVVEEEILDPGTFPNATFNSSHPSFEVDPPEDEDEDDEDEENYEIGEPGDEDADFENPDDDPA